MTLTRRDQRYGAQVAGVWTSVLGRVRRSWDGLDSWRDADVARFQRQALPVILGGQRTIAALTASYLESLYQELGEQPPRRPLDMDRVTGRSLRDVDPADVYRRPFVTAWSSLADDEPLDVALDHGARRLETILKTDLQLARTHTVREVAADMPRFTYTVRELQGEYDCALCIVASTQRYHKRNLAPIHPGCDCIVKTVTADYDPGQIIDEARLEQLHRVVEEATGQSDRGARAIDYRKIIVANDHGEIGPVLGFAGQRFTGPDDIPLPT
ncbi:hypothetical protein NPS70_16570 [Streptomyces sp. C10-9-1]|uniref:hypothetical protein n=1 Tax=Streptomyces sp. C10-9-1 TaxID=1859285 RepID=UPI002112A165|nr:hypothetical protein [Streptomyces sp. C10-9-1]MCQ6554801.1 hypothetical protein [Streptomyces sp. C10-9-1]